MKHLCWGCQQRWVGHDSDLKGCRRDLIDEKSSKPVSAGKNSRTFGLRGQHLKPCGRGRHPFFSSSNGIQATVPAGERAASSLCSFGPSANSTVPCQQCRSPPQESRRGFGAQPVPIQHDCNSGACDALCTRCSWLVASQAGIWVVAMEKCS